MHHITNHFTLLWLIEFVWFDLETWVAPWLDGNCFNWCNLRVLTLQVFSLYFRILSVCVFHHYKHYLALVHYLSYNLSLLWALFIEHHLPLLCAIFDDTVGLFRLLWFDVLVSALVSFFKFKFFSDTFSIYEQLTVTVCVLLQQWNNCTDFYQYDLLQFC